MKWLSPWWISGGCLLWACGVEPPCEPANLSPLGASAGFAVVTNDDNYVSSAIALLRPDGSLNTSAWIESGTLEPRLSAALSGDVVLPTAPLMPDTLAILDRSGIDNLTLISMPEATTVQQLSTTQPTGENQTAFRSNPQDALWLTATNEIVISRSQPNLDPDAPELDRGNDLLFIDATSGAFRRRIALDHLDLAGSPRIYARPYRMIEIENRLVVALARLSADFMTAGPGMIAIVDPEEETAVGVPLDTLRNCTDVVSVVDDPTRAIVACAGQTFGDEAIRRDTAGLALVHVTDDESPTVEAIWQATDDGSPVVTHGPISLGGGRAIAVAMGDLAEDVTDRLVLVDLVSGTAEVVHTSETSFSLGRGCSDASVELVLIPDATSGRPGIQRWHRVDGELELQDVVEVSPCRQFGPREVRPL